MQCLSLLIKPVSGRCNLRCRYCFYADTVRRRESGDRGVMSDETLEIVVRRAFAECDGLCSFGFQGGEPTLAGLEFYRRFVALQRHCNRRGIAVQNSIQTNGTTIDGNWADFFAEHRFLVGLSLDCRREVHDRLRPDALGDGTFDRVLDAARLLKERHVEFNILCVVGRDLARFPREVYAFLKERGFRYAQFIPCLDDGTAGETHAPDAEALGDFLTVLFDEWKKDLLNGDYYSIRYFDNLVRRAAGEMPEHCAMNGRCTGYPLIEADGAVYPCDFYATDGYELGNVREQTFAGMLTGPACARFASASSAVHPDCAACDCSFLCRGGCRREREPFLDGRPSPNRWCRAYRAFLRHALPGLREIVERITASNPA